MCIRDSISTKVAIPAALQTQSAALAAQGKTPLFFGGAGRLLGVIAVADTIKEDSPQAIRELRNMGIRVVMLTGYRDFEYACRAVELGVYQYLVKPVRYEDLQSIVEGALAEVQAELEQRRLLGGDVHRHPPNRRESSPPRPPRSSS